jgi:hypothetical protein
LQRVNDLFDSVELARAIDTEEFKRFLDCVPIAVVAAPIVPRPDFVIAI